MAAVTAPGGSTAHPAWVMSYYTYGRPGSADELRAATPVIKTYFAAAARNDGAAGCALQFVTFRNAIAEDIEQGPEPVSQRPKHCGPVLSKYFRRHRSIPTPNRTAIETTGIRIKGKQAIVFLRAPGVPAAELVMHREHGLWRVQDLLGKVLP
jgi:hypothetical protein